MRIFWIWDRKKERSVRTREKERNIRTIGICVMSFIMCTFHKILGWLSQGDKMSSVYTVHGRWGTCTEIDSEYMKGKGHLQHVGIDGRRY